MHVTETSRGATKLRALMQCSQVVQLARVGVPVLVVDVVCVMLVLIPRVVVHAVSTQFPLPVFCSWRCTLCTTRWWRWTASTVTELISIILHQIHCETHSKKVNRRFTDFRRFHRSISVKSTVAVMSQMRDATKNIAIATTMRKSFATNFGNELHPLLSWGNARLTTLVWRKCDALWALCRNPADRFFRTIQFQHGSSELYHE